ncbi:MULTISPECIES: hypothetical protein [Streptomyces]|uniref:hypothetical protein n=1 Tax=Streptomyces TaxID=1883 RepID=UPI00117E2137|nr:MULTISPECIES: hypothetical protein [Streptomyces]
MSRIVLTPALWQAMSDRAGKWRLQHDPVAHPISALRHISASRCVYVPLIATQRPAGTFAIDYIGSAARDHPRAVWRRIAGEHQLVHLDRKRDWDRVVVLPLKPDTPLPVVRIIEAAVADLCGRPPRCSRLPHLPTDWRARVGM